MMSDGRVRPNLIIFFQYLRLCCPQKGQTRLKWCLYYHRGTVNISDWVVPRQKNYQKLDFFLRNWIISNTIFKNWVVPYGHFKKSSGSMEPLEPPLTAPLILLSLFFCKISLQMIGECHGKAIIDPLFMVYDNKQMPKNE